jgi:hypothetical protein
MSNLSHSRHRSTSKRDLQRHLVLNPDILHPIFIWQQERKHREAQFERSAAQCVERSTYCKSGAQLG